MNRAFIFVFLAIFLFSTLAFAGGTAFDEDVDVIIGQQPELARFVHSELDFCKASWLASIRLARNYPLGGKRMGPYERRCRPKGSKENFDFILTVNTSYKGFNADGKEVDVMQAIKIDEKMISIDLRYDICAEDWCKAPQQTNIADPENRAAD